MEESKKEESKKYPDFVAYHYLNANGELLSMEENGNRTEKNLKGGLNVDGSSITGMCNVEKSDLKIMPEEDTYASFRIGKFDHHRFMCHSLGEDGKPHPRDPRGILLRIVEKCRSMGFEPYMFSEIEFNLYSAKVWNDSAGYNALPPDDRGYVLRHQLGRLCKRLGINVKRIHHEGGKGQNEIELDFAPCLKNADDTVFCMWLIRLIAQKRGLTPNFSPKPYKNEPGNGLHHHIILKDIKTGKNIFMNSEFKGDLNNPADNMQRLSQLCKHGIAGVLKYADDITAVFAASNESFLRLQPGFEAPIFKAWDFSNRTTLVRVPKSDLESTRFEYRGGDLSGSVHLYGAVLLAAVLKGIEEKLELPPNADFNVEKMSPADLADRNIMPVPLSITKCIKLLKSSKFLKEAFGQSMIDYLIERDEKAQKQSS